MARSIEVEGLAGLQRAFRAADKALSKELKVALREAAEPVRADAETLAIETITKIGIPWSRMRVGVTQKEVYVAPRQRGRHTAPGRRRPNLKTLLLDNAMGPALARNEELVVGNVNRVLGHVGDAWERA